MFEKLSKMLRGQKRDAVSGADPAFKIEGDVLVRWNSKEAVCVVPEGIREIGDKAFSTCFALREIVFAPG